jgi:hypothetical protein
MIKMKTLEVRRDNEVLCVYVGEEQFPDASTMRSIKESGCKFYMDGKIYKPEKKVRNSNEGKD